MIEINYGMIKKKEDKQYRKDDSPSALDWLRISLDWLRSSSPSTTLAPDDSLVGSIWDLKENKNKRRQRNIFDFVFDVSFLCEGYICKWR